MSTEVKNHRGCHFVRFPNLCLTCCGTDEETAHVTIDLLHPSPELGLLMSWGSGEYLDCPGFMQLPQAQSHAAPRNSRPRSDLRNKKATQMPAGDGQQKVASF